MFIQSVIQFETHGQRHGFRGTVEENAFYRFLCAQILPSPHSVVATLPRHRLYTSRSGYISSHLGTATSAPCGASGEHALISTYPPVPPGSQGLHRRSVVTVKHFMKRIRAVCVHLGKRCKSVRITTPSLPRITFIHSNSQLFQDLEYGEEPPCHLEGDEVSTGELPEQGFALFHGNKLSG